MPSFVDLFSGAGGLSLGLLRAGWRALLAIDNWDDAVETYRENFDHPVRCADIGTLSADDIIEASGEKPAWVVGGPPCKGFSTVGKRDKTDPRNELVWEYIRIVGELQPRGVVVENVLGMRDMNFVEEICKVFDEIGYFATPFVLRSADYGVPQLRRRIFFIADREGRAFVPPAPTHTRNDWVTVWDAIGDLPELSPGQAKDEYGAPPETEYQRRLREGSNGLQGHRASNHADHLVKAISFIPDGGNRRHIPDEFQPSSGFHNSYSRLHSKSPAVAITQNMGKPSGTRCVHPFQDRGLTSREGARLQGFPDHFHFAGGIISQREQVANAVPPLLAEVLGEALLDSTRFVDPGSAEFQRIEGKDQMSLDLSKA